MIDPDQAPRLRAPSLVQHRAQDAVDAEPGVPEAGVGVDHFPFGPRGSMVPGQKAVREADRSDLAPTIQLSVVLPVAA